MTRTPSKRRRGAKTRGRLQRSVSSCSDPPEPVSVTRLRVLRAVRPDGLRHQKRHIETPSGSLGKTAERTDLLARDGPGWSGMVYRRWPRQGLKRTLEWRLAGKTKVGPWAGQGRRYPRSVSGHNAGPPVRVSAATASASATRHRDSSRSYGLPPGRATSALLHRMRGRCAARPSNFSGVTIHARHLSMGRHSRMGWRPTPLRCRKPRTGALCHQGLPHEEITYEFHFCVARSRCLQRWLRVQPAPRRKRSSHGSARTSWCGGKATPRTSTRGLRGVQRKTGGRRMHDCGRRPSHRGRLQEPTAGKRRFPARVRPRPSRRGTAPRSSAGGTHGARTSAFSRSIRGM